MGKASCGVGVGGLLKAQFSRRERAVDLTEQGPRGPGACVPHLVLPPPRSGATGNLLAAQLPRILGGKT